MVSFIDDQREAYGVEPIGSQRPIAPSAFYDHQVKQRDPERRFDRAWHDNALCVNADIRVKIVILLCCSKWGRFNDKYR